MEPAAWSFGPLVTAGWLADHLDDVDVVDVRWSIPKGPHRSEYLDGHLPGAVFADLDQDLSAPPGPVGRHPLPSPEEFARARGRLGLGGRPVVAYDDRSGATAARLWWMLDAIGLEAAVLDGGLDAWTGPLEDGWRQPDPVTVDPRPWPADRFLVVDEVLDAIAAGSVLLDARSADRFAGLPNPIDGRPGHIPGSRSRPWERNLGADGRLRNPGELLRDFRNLGVDGGGDLVASCGSGVTGCHLLLAAAVAGLAPGRLYTGSWSEWSASPDRPVATDD